MLMSLSATEGHRNLTDHDNNQSDQDAASDVHKVVKAVYGLLYRYLVKSEHYNLLLMMMDASEA